MVGDGFDAARVNPRQQTKFAFRQFVPSLATGILQRCGGRSTKTRIGKQTAQQPFYGILGQGVLLMTVLMCPVKDTSAGNALLHWGYVHIPCHSGKRFEYNGGRHLLLCGRAPFGTDCPERDTACAGG